MISKIVAFKSSDGETFDTLERVQQHEIELILIAAAPKVGTSVEEIEADEIAIDVAANTIVTKALEIVNILSTKGNSRPAARKANGAVRKKRGSAISGIIQHSETEA